MCITSFCDFLHCDLAAEVTAPPTDQCLFLSLVRMKTHARFIAEALAHLRANREGVGAIPFSNTVKW